MKLMRSWALVCDVYFLEPQTKRDDESSQEFAERVQRLIADRARLKVAPWDGYLKYYNLGDKVGNQTTMGELSLQRFTLPLCTLIHSTQNLL